MDDVGNDDNLEDSSASASASFFPLSVEKL